MLACIILYFLSSFFAYSFVSRQSTRHRSDRHIERLRYILHSNRGLVHFAFVIRFYSYCDAKVNKK